MNFKTIIGGLHRRYKYIVEMPLRMRAISDSKQKKEHILNEKRKRNNKRIKVGFIVQMPEVWDKEAPIFEAMLIDEHFDVYMIIVPHYDFVNSRLEQYGEERKYFTEKYPDAKTVLLKDVTDMVIDDSYDYIFYQRCWENYLPEQLRCKNVINYAMTCYIPYCYHCAPEPTTYYQKDFFWYLSKFYCCSIDQYEQVKKLHNIECQYLGYPVLDSLQYNNIPHKSINVLWTPRWTDDIAVGGTSFNRNREKIIEVKNLDEKINLILRPHPLTFENAIKQGWMTETEVNDYKERVIKSGVCFDKNKIIEDTFLDTDILITDFTSAIISFYLSGKPIIYCAETDFSMIDTFRDILGTLYIAKDWGSVKNILSQLLNGHDPLYERRQEIIKKIISDSSSVDRIIDDLIL